MPLSQKLLLRSYPTTPPYISYMPQILCDMLAITTMLTYTSLFSSRDQSPVLAHCDNLAHPKKMASRQISHSFKYFIVLFVVNILDD